MIAAKVIVDGKNVVVRKMPWDAAEAKMASEARCVGKCRVYFEDATWVNAFLMASTNTNNLGDRFAMFISWVDELGGRSSRIVCIPLADGWNYAGEEAPHV